jgi:hypothetical protein
MKENDAKDTGIVLSKCRRIRDATGGAILLIHHSGKDADKGMRGSSSLLGAADVVLRVAEVGDGRSVRVEKNRDGESGSVFGFKFEQVEFGIDHKGKPLRSIVAIPSMKALIPPRKEPTGSAQSTALNCLMARYQRGKGGVLIDARVEALGDKLSGKRARRTRSKRCSGP